MKKLHKWVVSPKCTGKYRSFSVRAWPSLETNDERGHLLACIIDTRGQSYDPSMRVRTDLCLKVRLYDYSKGTQGRTSGHSLCVFKSIQEAKAWSEKVIAKHPERLPEGVTNEAH